MMITNQSAIIREKNIDDGTTGGHNIYQTADGRWWKEVPYCPPDHCGTGEIRGTMIGQTIKW
jgi:hypothetical protein